MTSGTQEVSNISTDVVSKRIRRVAGRGENDDA
jgi:hypothetical protein